MSEFNLTRIDRLRYRPSRQAEEFLGDLRSSLIPGDKATVARLAIGRSLAEFELGEDIKIQEGTEMGNAIEGIHLFGDDADIWACLLSAASLVAPTEAPEFRSLVEAHWHRGAQLLKIDYEDVKKSDMDFVIRLAGMLPFGGGIADGLKVLNENEGPIFIKFGEKSIDPVTNECISFSINAPGISPHIAIIGKTRSGKTRTGLDIAKQISSESNFPILLIDPKGEFVKDGVLIPKTEWGDQTLEKFFPGIRPLDVPRTPIPLDFLWTPREVSEHELAQLAISFQDSFQKCIRVKGDIKLDLLRQTVLTLLQGQRILDTIENLRRPITLEAIQEGFNELSEQNGQSAGSIGAKLGAITSLNMFEPKMSPGEFFSGRWVVSFGSATDEPKRLAIFLILDALNSYFMSLIDSRLNQENSRMLRHLLIIDEAVEVLRYRHGALSSLIRKSASKGGVVMLLSQSADDFDQETDDFLEQMGTVGVFALSSSNVRCLDGVFGRKMRIEEFSDKSLTTGMAFVKRPSLGPQKIIAWN